MAPVGLAGLRRRPVIAMALKFQIFPLETRLVGAGNPAAGRADRLKTKGRWSYSAERWRRARGLESTGTWSGRARRLARYSTRSRTSDLVRIAP